MFNINTQSPYSVAQLFEHKKNFFERAIIISCVFVLMFYIEILKHFFRWASIIEIEFSKYKVLFVFFSLKKVTLPSKLIFNKFQRHICNTRLVYFDNFGL